MEVGIEAVSRVAHVFCHDAEKTGLSIRYTDTD